MEELRWWVRRERERERREKERQTVVKQMVAL